jgi:5-methylcytosine-specific restriction enzyme subunit McrC
VKHLVVAEHTRIERSHGGPARDRSGIASLESRLYDRLRLFDRNQHEEGERVFEWSDGFARTMQWVGVVQIPGLQVEILPKIDVVTAEVDGDGDLAQHQARRNLLYMLAVGGDVPVRSRDIARLAVRKAPLSETLAAIFADRLRRELLRGPERGYVEQRENLRQFKGKLLVPRHVVRNAAHRERFFCEFDEFLDDTPMNRIFKASSRVLLVGTRTPATQDSLRQCLLLLDGVSDIEIQDTDFGHITINRQNERFQDVLRFCRLILSGRTPTVQAGGARTFSLLFDMNKVFERFVAGFLRQHVVVRLPDVHLFPHATHHARHLMTSGGVGTLRLEPDLLLEGPDGRLVMDTKWKLLAAGKRRRGGVAESDLYQLYAYTRRYGCARSVLLYPHTPGLEPRDFDVIDATGERSGERVLVRQVRLHRDLHQDSERQALAVELEDVVREGLQLLPQSGLHSVVLGSAV